jgi:hypothetical protein
MNYLPILLISASQVARITGLRHWLRKDFFFKYILNSNSLLLGFAEGKNFFFNSHLILFECVIISRCFIRTAKE